MEVLRKAVSNTSKTRHSKLPENWGEIEERVKDGVTFHLKYLGSTLVEELEHDDDSYGNTISAEAIRTIVAMAKASGKKLAKMAVTISPHGIQVVDMLTKEVKTDLSIYRISFCTADKNYEKIFGYIARNTDNETMECHAFLSPKKKIAEAVTLTVSEAFNIAKQQELQKQSQDASKIPEYLVSSCGLFTQNVPTESTSRHHVLISGDQNRTAGDSGLNSSTAGNAVTLGFEDNFTDLSCFASSQPNVVPWQDTSSHPESYSKDDKVTLQPWRPIEELSPQSSVDDLLLL